MKKIILTLLLLLGIGRVAYSQGSLVSYDPTGQPGDQASQAATPGINGGANITFSSLTRGSVSANAGSNSFNSNFWSLGSTFASAQTGNDYIEFTITPSGGFQFSIATFRIRNRRSTTGPSNVSLRSSLDGFSTDVRAWSPTTADATETFTPSGLTNVTSAVTFRIFGWNATSDAGTFRIVSSGGVLGLEIDGTVTPAGPPDFTGGATIAPGTYNNVALDQNCTISPAGNVTVNGVLNLGSFRLDAGSNLVIVANDAEAAIVATPGVGRINGGLRRAVIAPSVSARTYAFPLGDATRNRGVVVALPNTAGTSPTLTAAFDGTNPGTGGIGSLTPTVSNVWPGGFWRVSQNNLISTAYSIALSTDGVDGILNPSTVRIIKRPDAATNWTEAVVSSPVTLSGLTGQQASFLTGFSEFGFGGAGDNPLPVELSSFTGSATAAGVNLRWTTQSELNNAGFAVFRNGEEIASYRFSPALRGKGTAVGATNYAFLDAGVEVGQRYTYRLRSFDLDGTIHDYPQTVSVEVREPISQRVFNYDLSQNFPNPFNPTTSIKYSIREAGNVSLKVYDLLGREVLTLVNQVQAPGEYQVSFDASNLAASGMYIYRLQSGNFTRTMKMLLVK